MIKVRKIAFLFVSIAVSTTACNRTETQVQAQNQTQTQSQTDLELISIINTKNLTGDALKGRVIPNINSPKAQLGMRLFATKSLGGDHDSACITCHHPALGGGDNLSFSIGVGAEIPNLLGDGRLHSHEAINFDGSPPVPRNAPTTFNVAGWDEVLFHDGRVESLGKTKHANGNDGQGIRTPDSPFNTQDVLAGIDLPAAQARFPVTSKEEMKGFNYNDKNNQEIRNYLASRLGGYGTGVAELDNTDYWLVQFQTALENSTGTAEELITEQNIALLISEYERSQAFSNTPWRHYIEGDLDAISASAKEGGLLFFRSVSQGGAGCASCHSGDFFSDEKFHNIAMPQIGHGKGDGADGSADFGRFRESKDEADKFAFRTPTLLNVEVTKPWGHSGAYTSLEAVVKHHLNPQLAVTNYDFAQLTQAGIANLDKMQINTQPALDKLEADRLAGVPVLQNVNLQAIQIIQVVDFLKTLTDPCVKDAECIAKWTPPAAEDPNGDQLDAIDSNGEPL